VELLLLTGDFGLITPGFIGLIALIFGLIIGLLRFPIGLIDCLRADLALLAIWLGDLEGSLGILGYYVNKRDNS
jgi:hypothetical protein